jgi:8-oxo-dGTP diphosphatase
MGHPTGAVTLPAAGYEALAREVDAVTAWHGAPPAELVAALGGVPAQRPAQLAAIAWLFDPTRRHLLLVHHRVFGWSCPGGHVERGELPADAAARELAEETGLALLPDDRRPMTVSRATAPADDTGPAHDHWLVGYRFTAPLDAELRPERDPLAWHQVDALPAPRTADLEPLLEHIFGGER